jgi:hypothetical protein
MAQRAGIALSRLAYDADFSITQVDGAPEPPTFSPPVHHKLVDGHTIKYILDTFKRSVGFDTRLLDNKFIVCHPISILREQRRALRRATDRHSHLYSWTEAYSGSIPSKVYVDLLFIDLTPGQIASQAVRGFFEDRKWGNKSLTRVRDSQSIVLDHVATLSVREVIDRLISPWSRKFDRIGVFQHEGTLDQSFIEDLKAEFPQTPIDWLTLDDLSYGAAIKVHRLGVLDSIYPYEKVCLFRQV